MRRTLTLLSKYGSPLRPKLIQIQGGTFYREHPSTKSADLTGGNSPLFPNLHFELSAAPVQEVDKPVRRDEHWAIISATGGTNFLEVLRGHLICAPPTARTFPFLSSDEIDEKDHRLRVPSRAIQYVGFNPAKGQGTGSGIRGAYLSARYESHREETDWSLLQYLKGDTELNPAENADRLHVGDEFLQQITSSLRLEKLLSMPVSNLSNGQTRRAKIAKALLGKPELLLLDDPFMGLDPPTLVSLSPILQNLAVRSTPLLLLALRPQDPIPQWITHLVVLGEKNTVALSGRKEQVLFSLHRWIDVFFDNAPRGTRAYDRRWSILMTEAYGRPLLGVGDTLDQHGVSKYTAYDDVMQHKGSVVTGYGGMRKRYLSPEDQETWQKADDVPPPDRTLQDWLSWVSSKPSDSLLENLTPSSSSSEDKPDPTAIDSANELGQESGHSLGQPLIELQSVVVKYGEKVVLGFPPSQAGYLKPGLNLTIRQGTRLALIGPNGSGKTTLLSLLTSDHPQSYSLPIKFFGRSRLPSSGQPGLSLWDIQSRIGHSSPEVHAFFPRRLNVRQVLESAWSETYTSRPKLSHERDLLVDAFLRWWEPELRQTPAGSETYGQLASYNYTGYIRKMIHESYPPLLSEKSYWGDRLTDDPGVKLEGGLEWAEDLDRHVFGVLPVGTQRLLLLLRAIIKKPDILILDEAFSGLSSQVRDKAMCWLTYGETRFVKISKHKGNFEVPNNRLDILRLTQKLGLELSEVLRGFKKLEYARIRELSREELIQISQEMEEVPEDSTLDGWKFQGLTNDQALVVVSHIKEEIPGIVDEYVRLPGEEEVIETGRTIELGKCENGLIRTAAGWNQVWGFR